MVSSILLDIYVFFHYVMLRDCGSVLRPHPPSALYWIHFTLIGLLWSSVDFNKLSFFLSSIEWLQHRAWTASMKLRKNHKSKIIFTCWETDIRKWLSRWKVESYLTMPPEKVKMQEFQLSLLCTLQTQWLTAKKRTKLEYYQDQINPLCWSSFMTPNAPAQPYISTPIPLLYHRNIARFCTWSHTFAIEKGSWLKLPRHDRICRVCDS